MVTRAVTSESPMDVTTGGGETLLTESGFNVTMEAENRYLRSVVQQMVNQGKITNLHLSAVTGTCFTEENIS